MVKQKFPTISVKTEDGQPYPIEYIYSDTTLNELERILDKKKREQFLELLKTMNAKYIRVNLETEAATFEEIDPFENYDSHVHNQSETKDVISAFQDFSYKMISGSEVRSHEDIWGTIFRSSLDLIKSSIPDFESEQWKEEQQKITGIIDGLEHSFDDFIKTIADSFPETSLNALKELKSKFPYTLQEINNIEPELAVSAIWERSKEILDAQYKTSERIEDFFERIMNTNKDQRKPWKALHKINMVYNFLNYFGYWQDENLDRKRKFIPSLNDASHAYYAAFSSLFITRDLRLFMKLKAVYSYFQINTKIFHYDEKKES